MNLKSIIVEDETISREILRNYLGKYCTNVTVIGEAANIVDAEALIKANDVDLVFLDVEMPFGNAFDLLDRFPDRDFETVIVTAYNQYAIDALNNQASYYLMKPINIDELIKAVDYVTEVKIKEDLLQEKVLSPINKGISGKITIPQQDGFQVLNTTDIFFCKADDNYTEIHLEGKKILVSKTLKYFETALASFPFARIHKSFLVNVNEVAKYKKGKGGSVVLSNGKELVVSASKKKALLSYFE